MNHLNLTDLSNLSSVCDHLHRVTWELRDKFSEIPFLQLLDRENIETLKNTDKTFRNWRFSETWSSDRDFLFDFTYRLQEISSMSSIELTNLSFDLPMQQTRMYNNFEDSYILRVLRDLRAQNKYEIKKIELPVYGRSSRDVIGKVNQIKFMFPEAKVCPGIWIKDDDTEEPLSNLAELNAIYVKYHTEKNEIFLSDIFTVTKLVATDPNETLSHFKKLDELDVRYPQENVLENVIASNKESLTILKISNASSNALPNNYVLPVQLEELELSLYHFTPTVFQNQMKLKVLTLKTGKVDRNVLEIIYRNKFLEEIEFINCDLDNTNINFHCLQNLPEVRFKGKVDIQLLKAVLVYGKNLKTLDIINAFHIQCQATQIRQLLSTFPAKFVNATSNSIYIDVI